MDKQRMESIGEVYDQFAAFKDKIEAIFDEPAASSNDSDVGVAPDNETTS